MTYTVFTRGRSLIYKVNTGSKGDSATIKVGKVSIGTFPKVENVGTSSNAILDFTIPVSTFEGEWFTDEELSDISINPVQNKVITTKINEIDTTLEGKANVSHTHTKSDITDFPNFSNVAYTGRYKDLIGIPEIVNISVDKALSTTSENPVQNKIITNKINEKADLVHYHTRYQITDFPTALPASDVSAWAKAPTKPQYDITEINNVARVAITGNYEDLTNAPSISELVCDDYLSTTSTNPVQNLVITNRINLVSDNLNIKLGQKVDASSLSAVATSGNYNDLINRPPLSDVAYSGSYSDLIDTPVIASAIEDGNQGLVNSSLVYNYVETHTSDVDLNIATESEVLAIIEEATSTYSESLLLAQINEINGENV